MEIGKKPPWLGVEEYHANHRSRLCQKNSEHYHWQETDTVGNLWPITKNHGNWVYMKDGKVVGKWEQEELK